MGSEGGRWKVNTAEALNDVGAGWGGRLSSKVHDTAAWCGKELTYSAASAIVVFSDL